MLVSIHWGLKDIGLTFEATAVSALVAARTLATRRLRTHRVLPTPLTERAG
jgi:hypothetical protein